MNFSINRENILKLFIFLFPILLTSVQSGGSIIYTLILIIVLSSIKELYFGQDNEDKLYWYGFLTLFLIAIFSLIYTEDINESFQRIDKFFRLMTGGLIYLYLIRKKIVLSHYLIYGSAVSALILGVFSIYEVYYLKFEYARGNYYSIGVSDYGVLYSFLVLGYLLQFKKNDSHQFFLIISILSGLYASYLSGGRGGWLAIPVLIFILLFLTWKYYSKKSKKIIIVGLLICSTTLVYFMPQNVTNRLELIVTEINLFSQDPSKFSSVGNRLNLWRNSLIIFSENPFFGVGLGDFDIENNLLVQKGLSPANLKTGHAHNIFFDALATIGLIGFTTLVCALFIIPFYIAYKNRPQIYDPNKIFLYTTLIMTLGAYAIFGLTEAWLSRNIFVNGYVIIIAVLLSSLRISTDIKNDGSIKY